ncbi:MAG TPA: MBL fold hydrolase [Porphyromonadaceae bacterium]|nr:MBL fold hydrolase [Porphyromonadaceae bacterium]
MRETSVSRIVVGDIAANCWVYPLDDFECGGAGVVRPLPSGFRGCALIDPGAEARRIIAHLEKLKMIPVYIFLTHGHFDHIAALPEIVSAYNKPLVAIHGDDARYLGGDSYRVHCESFAAAVGNAAYVDALWKDMPPPDIIFKEGDNIGPFTIISLPGHTPGSIALWDKEAKNLFSGDTLFQAGYGRTDLPGGNEVQLIESLRRLFALDGNIKVYPGHGPVTTIGEEAARGMI